MPRSIRHSDCPKNDEHIESRRSLTDSVYAFKDEVIIGLFVRLVASGPGYLPSYSFNFSIYHDHSSDALPQDYI
ncbi:hypothetical protein FRC12_017468 [Ceratobasidium sp. 428]|nr:hypothetical protein FRC12_017468 [Ceratobasidium sp. 428]